MKKKTKEGKLNLFYMDEAEKQKNITKKKKSNKNSKSKSNSKDSREIFDLDNEIIIGVKVPSNSNNANSRKKSKTQKKTANNVKKNKSDYKRADNNSAQRKNSKKVKKKRNTKIIKLLILAFLLIGAIACFLLSPIFNIKSIKIQGNLKFSEDTYISLSKIQLDTNIFNINKKYIINNIKQNAYVDDVEITRRLPDEILITVKERQATYMVEYNGSYMYMNNQGYFLEISNEALKVPIIKGISTAEENIKVGKRLEVQDLKKMEVVLQIATYAESYSLSDKITAINIKDKSNYIVEMSEEEKNIYLGDASNINERMIKLPLILEKEKGNKGDIIINMDLSKKDPYFSPKE